MLADPLGYDLDNRKRHELSVVRSTLSDDNFPGACGPPECFFCAYLVVARFGLGPRFSHLAFAPCLEGRDWWRAWKALGRGRN